MLNGIECAYVLRFVELNHRKNASDPWSLRQSAVYHQYRATTKSSTWLIIALSQRAQARLESYASSSGDVCRYNPFEVHLLLLDTATANWRPYLVDIAAQTNEQVSTARTIGKPFDDDWQADRVVMASIDDDSPIRITEFEERQRLKQVEDKILDLLIIMDSTLDTIDSLSHNYGELQLQSALAVQRAVVPNNDPISFALAEKRRDVLLYKSKVEALRWKVKGTTKLVGLNLMEVLVRLLITIPPGF
jgi:hypothetical protein